MILVFQENSHNHVENTLTLRFYLIQQVTFDCQHIPDFFQQHHYHERRKYQ